MWLPYARWPWSAAAHPTAPRQMGAQPSGADQLGAHMAGAPTSRAPDCPLSAAGRSIGGRRALLGASALAGAGSTLPIPAASQGGWALGCAGASPTGCLAGRSWATGWPSLLGRLTAWRTASLPGEKVGYSCRSAGRSACQNSDPASRSRGRAQRSCQPSRRSPSGLRPK